MTKNGNRGIFHLALILSFILTPATSSFADLSKETRDNLFEVSELRRFGIHSKVAMAYWDVYYEGHIDDVRSIRKDIRQNIADEMKLNDDINEGRYTKDEYYYNSENSQERIGDKRARLNDMLEDQRLIKSNIVDNHHNAKENYEKAAKDSNKNNYFLVQDLKGDTKLFEQVFMLYEALTRSEIATWQDLKKNFPVTRIIMRLVFIIGASEVISSKEEFAAFKSIFSDDNVSASDNWLAKQESGLPLASLIAKHTRTYLSFKSIDGSDFARLKNQWNHIDENKEADIIDNKDSQNKGVTDRVWNVDTKGQYIPFGIQAEGGKVYIVEPHKDSFSTASDDDLAVKALQSGQAMVYNKKKAYVSKDALPLNSKNYAPEKCTLELYHNKDVRDFVHTLTEKAEKSQNSGKLPLVPASKNDIVMVTLANPQTTKKSADDDELIIDYEGENDFYATSLQIESAPDSTAANIVVVEKTGKALNEVIALADALSREFLENEKASTELRRMLFDLLMAADRRSRAEAYKQLVQMIEKKHLVREHLPIMAQNQKHCAGSDETLNGLCEEWVDSLLSLAHKMCKIIKDKGENNEKQKEPKFVLFKDFFEDECRFDQKDPISEERVFEMAIGMLGKLSPSYTKLVKKRKDVETKLGSIREYLKYEAFDKAYFCYVSNYAQLYLIKTFYSIQQLGSNKSEDTKKEASNKAKEASDKAKEASDKAKKDNISKYKKYKKTAAENKDEQFATVAKIVGWANLLYFDKIKRNMWII